MMELETQPAENPAHGAGSAPASGESEEGLRASMYALLASLLASPPSDEMLNTLCSIDAGEDDYTKRSMEMAWKGLKLAAEATNAERVDDEYHALFIGIGRGELVPFGSWYLTGFLMDRPLAYLRRDLDALGIERQNGVGEPEDHAAALCEAMCVIARSGDEIPLRIQRQFYGDHLHSWMRQFFLDLQEARSAQFYRAVGAVGEQFLNIEARYLQIDL